MMEQFLYYAEYIFSEGDAELALLNEVKRLKIKTFIHHFGMTGYKDNEAVAKMITELPRVI